MRLGNVSAKYESNGELSAISTGENDWGQKSYGPYQFSSAQGTVQSFIDFCKESYPDLYSILSQHEIATLEFDTDWLYLAEMETERFDSAVYEYTKAVYYDQAAANLKEVLSIDLEQHTNVLKDVVWSAAVQFSSHWIVELFVEAADYANKKRSEMLDADYIYWTYEVRLLDPSWSSGSPALRPGLFNRWKNEREDALAQLEKELIS